MPPPSAPPDASRQPDLRSDADGKVMAGDGRAGAALASRDRDTEQQLAELEAVYDAAPLGLCVLDTDLRFVRLNRRFAEINGVPVEEHIGRTPAEVVPDLGEQAEAAMRRVLESGELVELEVSGTTPARPGIVRHWNERWKPIRDGAGEIIGISISAEEVTERKAAEAALREANARLEERVRERTAELEDANARLHAETAERTQAATALQESEQRYRTVIETAGEGFVIAEPDGPYIFVNQRMAEMLGYPVDEILGKSSVDITFEACMPKVFRSRTALQEGLQDQGEFRFRKKDGSELWTRYNATPMFNVQGDHIANFVFHTDITERREIEERQAFLLMLSDALRPLADPVEIQSVAAQILGEHFRADRVNYFEIEGDDYVVERDYAPMVPHAIGRHPIASFGQRLLAEYCAGRTVVAPDIGADADLSPAERAAYEAIDVGAFVGVPLVKGGKLVAGLGVNVNAPRAWTAAEVSVIEETAERTWAAVERARAEEALRESEERYRELVEHAGSIILRYDPAGRITFINEFAERFFGYSAEELLGQHVIGTIVPETESSGRDLAEMVRDILCFPERYAENENENVRKNGERVWLRWTNKPIMNPDGTVREFLGIAMDITERKETELRLARYADQLRSSNEELQRFAYVASHDLQEPLRSIVSFSQLLERRYRGKLDADADEFIQFIIEGGNRMQRLIEDLLQLSRVETMAKPLAPTDTGGVVADVLRLMETSIREAGATVTVEPLPMVMADAAQLEQVFTNLIGNALKYRRPDLPPKIRISAERVGTLWRFAVADNGMGIEAEYFDRIFEMFRRLHTHDQYEGTGIGLAVVKKIVERHGGKVWVESVPGEGSMFFFTLLAARETKRDETLSSPMR